MTVDVGVMDPSDNMMSRLRPIFEEPGENHYPARFGLPCALIHDKVWVAVCTDTEVAIVKGPCGDSMMSDPLEAADALTLLVTSATAAVGCTGATSALLQLHSHKADQMQSTGQWVVRRGTPNLTVL